MRNGIKYTTLILALITITACREASLNGAMSVGSSKSASSGNPNLPGNGGESNPPTPPAGISPSVQLSANPMNVNYNQPTTLTWSSSNAAFCITPAGDLKTSGSFTTPALTSNTSFTLTCFGATGSGFDQPGTKTVDVVVQNGTVNPATLPSVILTPSAAAISTGQSVILSWSSTNAVTCTSSWGSSVGTSGSFTTGALSTTQSFVVSCENAAGTSNSTTTVTVNAPVAPPSASLVNIKIRKLDLTRVLLFKKYFYGGRYERFHTLSIFEGATANIPFYLYNWNSEKELPFGATNYKLLVDGVEKANVNVTSAQTNSAFTLDLSTVSEGWHELDIQGHSSETAAQYPVYVKKSANPPNAASMPFYLGTHTLMFDTAGHHITGTVPTRFTPTVIPLPPRETPAFNQKLTRKELTMTQVAPVRSVDVYRPNKTRTGIMTTMNTEEYFWSDLVAKVPKIALLDGPRGQGIVDMPTHIQMGRSGNIYFADPWRVGKITPDGYIKTLAGYRHRSNMPTYHGDVPDIELVGDWSAIPEARRGFHEIWGMAWDKRSVVLNIGAALINGEFPHINGPRLFIADSQNNRICLLTFSPLSHDVEPKVTEFITGLNDPWDVVAEDGVLYVSERKAHRIAAYDATTGAFLRVVVQGADMSGVDSNRFVYRKTDLATIQAQPVVGPEGIYYLSGWLYYGSKAMGQVKRVNLSTNVIEVAAPDIRTDGNSNFAKIAVSDGTFGPEGTVFVSTWSNNYYGYPQAFLLGGGTWDYISGGTEKGIPFAGAMYTSAMGVGQGKLVFGNSDEGLRQISKALPTDTTADMTKYIAGRDEYVDKGYDIVYGPAGWGYYSLPLPWGVSANIDYYLAINGHKK